MQRHGIRFLQANAWRSPDVFGLIKYQDCIFHDKSLLGILGIMLGYLAPMDANTEMKFCTKVKEQQEIEAQLLEQHAFDQQWGLIPHPVYSGYSLFQDRIHNAAAQHAFDQRLGLVPYVKPAEEKESENIRFRS